MTTTISNSNITAQINSLGAELFSLKNNSDREYMWEGNSVFWGKHSPVLFPIVGTLKKNSYTFDGVEYKLPRHGFAREKEFVLIEKTESSATFSLKSTEETKTVFPLDFELQIQYSLIENTLNIEYKVINNNTFSMPFSIGAHPAFALNATFENYSLEFEKQEDLYYFLLEEGLISNQSNKILLDNRQLKLDYSLFEKDALVFKSLESNFVTILEKDIPKLRVHFEDFKNLGIWTIKDAPFLCIEPWLGYADTVDTSGNIIEKEGIQLLGSKKSFNCNFNIELL